MEYQISLIDNWFIHDTFILEWSKETPAESGWYWVCFRDKFPLIIAYLDKDKGGFYFDIDNKKYSLDAFRCWLGPLAEPEPPNM